MQNRVMPIVSLSRPRLQSSSVWEGTKDIILLGGPLRVIICPVWSVDWIMHFLLQSKIKKSPGVSTGTIILSEANLSRFLVIGIEN
jgi:hypothetical protein